MAIERELTAAISYHREFGEYRVDRASSSLTYYGYAPKGTLESSQAWIVQREITTGTETHRTIAPYIDNGFGKTLQKWQDRTSLFPAAPWGNGYCTIFDGVNDYVNLGNNFNYERTNTFTFSAWIYVDNISNAMTIYSKRSAIGGAPGIQINMLSNGRLEANFVNTTTTNHLRVQMGVAILAKTKYHLCVTYDGSSTAAGVKLYLNGTLIALTTITATLSASILTSTDALIGQFNSGQFYNGKIDEVSFWNVELTGAEVLALSNGGTIIDPRIHSKAANLTNYYRAGDGDTFPTWSDSVGSVSGVMTNMASSALTRDIIV